VNTEVEALAQLRVTYPDGEIQAVPVMTSPFDIGRTLSNALVLPDTRVTHHHARLFFEGDRILLQDLGSRNGTFVNGRQLPLGQLHPLLYGDTLTIGPYTLTVERTPQPEQQPVPGLQPGQLPAASAPTAEAPPPPPPKPTGDESPPEPPPPAPPGYNPAHDPFFGLPPLEIMQRGKVKSRYLQFLPPIYDELDEANFLGRFLLAFEGVLTPVEQIVDNFDLYLDPHTTPEFFLGELAAWLDVTLDENWPLEKRRELVEQAAGLYSLRGTRQGLIHCLQSLLYKDLKVEITEPPDKPHHFEVVLRLSPGQAADRTMVERLIEANKPAHTTFSLQIVQA